MIVRVVFQDGMGKIYSVIVPLIQAIILESATDIKIILVEVYKLDNKES